MNSNPPRYETIDHTADLGIIVKGGNIKELFVNAANAMTDIMVKRDIEEKVVRREKLASEAALV